MTGQRLKVGALALALCAALATPACHKEGPAERTGEKIDNALDDHDLGKGPAQKAGESLDKAAQDVKGAAASDAPKSDDH